MYYKIQRINFYSCINIKNMFIYNYIYEPYSYIHVCFNCRHLDQKRNLLMERYVILYINKLKLPLILVST